MSRSVWSIDAMKTDAALDRMVAGERHPWYGPCDSLDDGECAECRDTVGHLAARVKLLERALVDLYDAHQDRATVKKFRDNGRWVQIKQLVGESNR